MLKNEKLDAALKYATIYGWPVFPVAAGSKKPATENGFKAATLDPTIICNWWNANPDLNIGVATGTDYSGLLVIDLDEKPEKNVSGVRIYDAYAERCGTFADTVISETPRGGRHMLFCTKTPFGSKAGVYPGVDVRCNGGYIVVPPSVVDGKQYRWLNDPCRNTLAEADSRVFSFICPAPAGISKRPFSMPDEIPEGRRTTTLMQLLGSLQAKGLTNEAIMAAVRAENDSRCSPPLTDNELENTVFPALMRFEKGTAPYDLDRPYSDTVADIVNHLTELQPEKNKRFGWHDAGNAALFAELFKDVLCFIPERKRWYHFDGTRWIEDAANMQTMKLCKIAADALVSYTITHINDEKTRSEYLKHVSKLQKYQNRETLIRDAASELPVSVSRFDNKPYLLNCRNGTLNLSDFSFREHRADDRMTKICGAEYHPDAQCERWEEFISEITLGDIDLARYIQKAFGYALTGETKHECFFILYGPTSRNGKGTLVYVFSELIGDYGKTARIETIAQKKYNDSRSPSEDIARLVGVRFVSLAEPDKSMILSSALVKTLTGGDIVNARLLGENSFDYKPQFKLFLNANYLPYASDPTLFASDRVQVIPFNRHFELRERDMGLKSKLVTPENLSGILNWCLSGLKALRCEGFKVPAAVRSATQQYRDSSDKIAQFIESKLERSPSKDTLTKTVHQAYQEWCLDNGYRPEGLGEFKKSLAVSNIMVTRKRPESEKHNPNANKKSFVIGYILKQP